MTVSRSPKNPIITPKNVKPSRDDFEVIGTFNAGVTRLKNQVILLLRVAERPINKKTNTVATAVYDVKKNSIVVKEFSRDDPENDFSDPRLIVKPTQTYLTSISHLRVARSNDGVNFQIDDKPAISPQNDYETFGIEDPRITLTDDIYYITYVAVSPLGVTTCLASTKDFNAFKRHCIIAPPDNKDIVLFPEKINGKYYALHRPVSPLFEKHEIWLADSPDLNAWGNYKTLLACRENSWDNLRIGASAPPFKIEQGWLEIYHGADKNSRYCLGAVLFDSNNPSKVIARDKNPILEPQADYEVEGFFGNVVFSCGLLYEQKKLKIYYGVADTSIAYAEIPLQDVLNALNL